MTDLFDDVEEQEDEQEKKTRTEKKKAPWADRDDLIPTGSTLLNLLLAENPWGGWREGSIVNTVGDSHAGKTMLALQGMADLANDQDRRDDYDLYYIDREHALEIDIPKLFKQLDKVLIREPDHRTVEELWVWLRRKLSDKKTDPFIFVPDSLDAYQSKEDVARKDKDLGRREIDPKPRVITGMLEDLHDLIEETSCLLNFISHAKQNIGVTFGDKKRRSGGDALRFFALHEIWLALVGAVTKTVRGKDVSIGNRVRIRCKKNKITGKSGKGREVDITILNQYGIDDVSSMVEWMVAKSFWAKSDNGIVDTHGDFGKGHVAKVVEAVEMEGAQDELRVIVGQCWMEMEEELSLDRSRY